MKNLAMGRDNSVCSQNLIQECYLIQTLIEANSEALVERTQPAAHTAKPAHHGASYKHCYKHANTGKFER